MNQHQWCVDQLGLQGSVVVLECPCLKPITHGVCVNCVVGNAPFLDIWLNEVFDQTTFTGLEYDWGRVWIPVPPDFPVRSRGGLTIVFKKLFKQSPQIIRVSYFFIEWHDEFEIARFFGGFDIYTLYIFKNFKKSFC